MILFASALVQIEHMIYDIRYENKTKKEETNSSKEINLKMQNKIDFLLLYFRPFKQTFLNKNMRPFIRLFFPVAKYV